ncbi:hypothetical protein EDB83DRAFT_119714 [Lactarius deliciosus]|nr:hypothetical protein EDB83DRAFT_119714 [Lactarius deliciosus]
MTKAPLTMVHARTQYPVFTNARRKKCSPASSPSGVLPCGLTLCHHYRCKTPLPKMRCMLIKASTDEQCRNLFCDLCIDKRYPQLTFDRSVEDPKVAPIAPRRSPQISARVENRYRCCRQPSSAQRRQQQRRMHRFLTRAGARPWCSRFLASLSVVRSCTATNRASYPSRNPRPPLPLLSPPLLLPPSPPARYPNPRKMWGRLVSLPDPEDDQPE